MSDASLKSILAATDLSPACDPVLRAAGAVALGTGAVLHVIHAFDLPPSPYLDARGGEATFPGRIQAARQALQAQVERTVPAGVAVTDPRIEIYAAHRAISGYAAALGVGLVVIGPHTHAGLAAGVLGFHRRPADAHARRAVPHRPGKLRAAAAPGAGAG